MHENCVTNLIKLSVLRAHNQYRDGIKHRQTFSHKVSRGEGDVGVQCDMANWKYYPTDDGWQKMG